MVKRTLIGVASAILVAVPAPQVDSAPTTSSGQQPTAADSLLLAGGGTQLSNGYFFPGTAISNNGEYVGLPLEVARGANVQFANLDHFVVAGGGHKVVSFKLVRRGDRKVPLFASKMVNGPGQGLIVTAHVKPGVYPFFCPIHTGMLGQIKVK